MTRRKKILMNTCIIVLLLFAVCYLGGFYFSRESCAKAILRAYQRDKEDVILELDLGNNRSIVLCGGQFENQYSEVELKKFGFLYRNCGTVGTSSFNAEESIAIGGWASEEDGQVVFIKRNDPNITTIEAKFENEKTITLDHWSQDLTAYHLETDGWLRGSYKCCDVSGNLIGEKDY